MQVIIVKRISHVGTCNYFQSNYLLCYCACAVIKECESKIPLTVVQYFTCKILFVGKAEYEIMQTAWRERNPQVRLKAAHSAIEKNPDCATAYILLAEEEATTITEAEKLLRQAYKVAEANYKKSQGLQHQGALMEAQHRR